MRVLMPLTAAATLVAAGLAADAQPRIRGGPTPGEQAGMHQDAATTSGSSTLIRERDGVRLDGYPHRAIAVFPDGHMGPVRREHQHDQR